MSDPRKAADTAAGAAALAQIEEATKAMSVDDLRRLADIATGMRLIAEHAKAVQA